MSYEIIQTKAKAHARWQGQDRQTQGETGGYAVLRGVREGLRMQASPVSRWTLTNARVVGVQVLRRHELRDQGALANRRATQHKDPGIGENKSGESPISSHFQSIQNKH